ncbi:MAG: hypothetical protein KKA07_13905 [Bacteroidetes bacterium]|nr:hypothetical protein [Bacteroidota bacterium]MBU1720156.1 hypothetical protein [Bacteroidota bacterium]
MKVAIFAEGRGDLAVLKNILKGKFGIDQSDIRFERPEYSYDQTDLAQMKPSEFSSWTLVKTACQKRDDIDSFLQVTADPKLVVIQIDTAEKHLSGYEVQAPKKKGTPSHEYSRILRNSVKSKIEEWLKEKNPSDFAYAICIEEMEAWLMTLNCQGNDPDTSIYNDPKTKIQDIWNKSFKGKQRKFLSEKDEFKKMDKLSLGFRKRKTLYQCSKYNESLKLFLESLDATSLAI